jgi:hypothetical protein
VRERDVENGGYFITIFAAGIFLFSLLRLPVLRTEDCGLQKVAVEQAERGTVSGRRKA